MRAPALLLRCEASNTASYLAVSQFPHLQNGENRTYCIGQFEGPEEIVHESWLTDTVLDTLGPPGGSAVKKPPAKQGDLNPIPLVGRPPADGHGHPSQ